MISFLQIFEGRFVERFMEAGRQLVWRGTCQGSNRGMHAEELKHPQVTTFYVVVLLNPQF
jgi:hypothetical protein